MNRQESIDLLKKCKVCLYDYVGQTKRFHFRKRICVSPKWVFNSSFVAFGVAIINQDGGVEWREEFRGGPFRIPHGGGEIAVDLGKVWVGTEDVLIRDLLEGEPNPLKWKQMGF